MVNYIGIEADYYIYAQRNGWEYGNTINYRANIGKTVQVPNSPSQQELTESLSKFLYSAKLIHGHLTKAALRAWSNDPATKPDSDEHSYYKVHSIPCAQIGDDPIAAILGFVGFVVVEELTWQQLLNE